MMLTPEFWARCEKYQVVLTKLILVVKISQQRLYCIASRGEPDGAAANQRLIRKLPCSTSKFGIGQQEGSNCTPLGLHCIREKIGTGQPANTVFKGRQPIGSTAEIPDARITTRILWLEGLEPGFNQGGNVDTHDRYVYIHGTANEDRIGSPDSHGCVHLRAKDLVPLFEEADSGTLVWIEE
jgi:L,D-transpeptidase YbiS